MNAKFNFEAGFFLRGPVRRYLQRAQFKYPDLKWTELKSLLDSEFIVKGPAEIVQKIHDDISRWANSI